MGYTGYGVKGDLLVSDGVNRYDLAVGSNNTLLIADSAQTEGIKWGSSLLSLTEIGVGTASPDRAVEILDASDPQLRLTLTDATYYTDLQHGSDATFGGLCLLPTANASGYKSVNFFGQNESQGISIFDDGGTLWIRSTMGGRSFGLNTGWTQSYSIGFATKLSISTTAIDLYVPGSYRVSGSSTTSTDEVLARYKATSATAGVGYGIADNWYLEDSAGNYPLLASSLDVKWTDASPGSYDAAMVFSVATSGTNSEVMRLWNGYVGIAQTVPSALLHIGSFAGYAVKVGGSGGNIFAISSVDDQVILGADTTSLNNLVCVEATTGFNYGIRFKRNSVSTNTALTNAYHYVNVDTSGGAVTISLPAANAASIDSGWEYIIKRNGGSNVTISPNGSNTIEGASSLIITVDGESYTLRSNGGNGASGNWEIV